MRPEAPEKVLPVLPVLREPVQAREQALVQAQAQEQVQVALRAARQEQKREHTSLWTTSSGNACPYNPPIKKVKE